MTNKTIFTSPKRKRGDSSIDVAPRLRFGLVLKRRASVLVIALVVLVVASAVCMEVVKAVVQRQRASRTMLARRQAQILAESALDRATVQLERSDEYTGETWKPESGLEAQITIEDGTIAVVSRIGEGKRVVTSQLTRARNTSPKRKRGDSG